MSRKTFFLTCALVLLFCNAAGTATVEKKSGDAFNMGDDIHWDEIELEFLGICICPRPPPVFYEEGEIWGYWEPYMALSTVSQPYYLPYLGQSSGGTAILDELGGKNASSNAASIANQSSFAQAHAWFLHEYFNFECARDDYGAWMTEFDSLWQSDELSDVIHPEATLFANLQMQMACMLDATATNLQTPIDAMFWCLGSGGSSYPMTGHVDNDDYVQANNTAAARLVYKLNRIMMICDTAESICGCENTFLWVKSHYKTHVIRPGDRSPAFPFGVTSASYACAALDGDILNPTIPPYEGDKGSSDEFMWMVYRRQLCCTCCE